MASLDEIRNVRLQKLELLKDKGMDPYPARVKKDFTLKEVVDDFSKLSGEGKEISLVGRIMSLRPQGGLVFFNFYDGTATFQGLLKKEDIEEEVFNLFIDAVDIGDFVEVSGTLFTTKREEKTLQIKNWKMAAKSLRPLPEKWHGLQDEEERFRRRYLDILTNEEVRDLFYKRTKFWNSMRNFLIERGFIEVETPVFENTAGGAEARPFVTHHNALDIDVYLRISCGELWQKRLMVAGFPKVFEIGRIFRNEGMDAEHLQDYTQMEFYTAYEDYNYGMDLTKEMYRKIAMDTFGTLKFTIKGFEVDLGKDWEIYDFKETIKKITGIDIDETNLKEAENKLQELKVEYDRKNFNLTRAIDNLWKYCRKGIGGPGFLINVPVYMEPLAKRKSDNKNLVERFQIIIAGSEVGKGFSELNDPIDQAGRFEDQSKLREAGDEEAQMFDHDFVEALEYGMPPTCGFGISERLFAFLADKPVRECQIFPLMRPKE
ncbi:MAG: lysine--tRNA ligase [Candidatus Paceibacterota bacterium]|jgi:lysyl-tRNA synthetase class 2